MLVLELMTPKFTELTVSSPSSGVVDFYINLVPISVSLARCVRLASTFAYVGTFYRTVCLEMVSTHVWRFVEFVKSNAPSVTASISSLSLSAI